MQFTMALALMIGFSSVSFAQEKAQSTLKTEAVHTDGRANKKFTEDTRITDIELKAQAGSLSRFSLKFDLSYSGPPVDDLSDPEMPNPDGRTRPNRTSLGGFMGGRFRINANEALNLSTGLKWYSPYHQVAGERVEKRPSDKDYEIADPMLSYDNTYPVGPTQMRSSVKGRLTTADFYLDRGQRGSLGFTQGLKYTVPESRWILGVLGDVDLYVFDREYERRDGRVSNYYLMFIPSIEYKILDTLNFRTSVAYAFANQRLKGSWLKWEDQAPTARAGFGWAITRSIYFNPFLNFFAERPAVHTTSLSFSTVFSIF